MFKGEVWRTMFGIYRCVVCRSLNPKYSFPRNEKHLRNVERMERSQRRVHGRLCKIMVILIIPSWRMLLNWLLSRHRSAPNCSIASMEKAWKLAKKWWVKIQINIIKSEEIPENFVYIFYLQIFNTLFLGISFWKGIWCHDGVALL